MDYKWAQELGLIRKPASFMTSICDERGEELLYAGMPISDVFKVRMNNVDHPISTLFFCIICMYITTDLYEVTITTSSQSIYVSISTQILF